MSRSFEELSSDMRRWFDTFGAYIEGATIMPRTRGALRELHASGVALANEIQTRSTDVSTCNRLSSVETELQRLSSVVAALVESDTAVHTIAEESVSAQQELAAAVETLAVAESQENENGQQDRSEG